MKRTLLCLILMTALRLDSHCQENLAVGRVLGEDLQPCIAAFITNQETGIDTHTDENGDFNIKANVGDSLLISYVAYSNEFYVFSGKEIRLIMIEKTVNSFGAVWTERKYKRAYRQLAKYHVNLYKSADELNLWD